MTMGGDHIIVFKVRYFPKSWGFGRGFFIHAGLSRN